MGNCWGPVIYAVLLDADNKVLGLVVSVSTMPHKSGSRLKWTFSVDWGIYLLLVRISSYDDNRIGLCPKTGGGVGK